MESRNPQQDSHILSIIHVQTSKHQIYNIKTSSCYADSHPNLARFASGKAVHRAHQCGSFRPSLKLIEGVNGAAGVDLQEAAHWDGQSGAERRVLV